jgi:hypothetical protein
MPAGRFYGHYTHALAETLTPFLVRHKLALIREVFIFYRDWEGRKQRIAPDMLIAPAIGSLHHDQIAASYDLDKEPLPICVIELTSPTNSLHEVRRKRLFYAALGIQEYALLDIVDAQGRLHPQLTIRAWRLQDDLPLALEPDAEGFTLLAGVGVKLRFEKHMLAVYDATTGERLRTSSELLAELDALQRAREAAEARAREAAERQAAAEARADTEAEARAEVEQRAVAEARAREAAELRAAAEAEARAEVEAAVQSDADTQAASEPAPSSPLMPRLVRRLRLRRRGHPMRPRRPRRRL